MTIPTESRPNPTAVTTEIVDLLRAEFGVADLTPDSDLVDNGLDSMKVMSLVFKIEVRYDIHLEEADVDDIHTVGDLADLVVRRIDESP